MLRQRAGLIDAQTATESAQRDNYVASARKTNLEADSLARTEGALKNFGKLVSEHGSVGMDGTFRLDAEGTKSIAAALAEAGRTATDSARSFDIFQRGQNAPIEAQRNRDAAMERTLATNTNRLEIANLPGKSTKQADVLALQDKYAQLRELRKQLADDKEMGAEGSTRRNVIRRQMQALEQEISGLSGSQSGVQQGKKLDASTAKAILDEAGGDKQRARQLAQERGYSF